MRAWRFTRIRGYLLILIKSGSPERFFNICNVHQIELWNLCNTSEGYEFYISIKDFRRLKPVIRKTRTRIIIKKRYGFPFFLHKYRFRKAFFVGIAAAFVCVYLLSLFIWDIHIEGNYSYTEQVLLDYLSSEQIVHGMRRDQVDCDRIEKLLRSKYSDIIWVSASISGTRLMIQVEENFNNWQEREESGYCNIVADKDCRITSIVTRSGTPLVKQGDVVAKGDILVSGSVEIKDEAGGVLRTEYTVADADICGESILYYEDQIPLEGQKKIYTGEEAYAWSVSILGNRLFLKAGITGFEHFDILTENHPLVIGTNFYLPFSLEKWYYKEYCYEQENLTEEEAEKALKKNINDFFEKLLQKGVQIVGNNVKIAIDEKMGSASGRIVVICPQGKAVPFGERNDTIYEHNGNDT